ncbi:hypothetical protein SRABI98_01512 [Microbacterium sp. Bi98]|uniref:hypothetical protein n=1 Tax=unclassified Microbacterium TaxID=2609290 RepID=UPI000701D86D|nr:MULTISPECIES: hypothetical protein [unclassified Microbacterium]KRD52466.1 hypothetical protein ASE34_11560 [Microbacterium sp. Root280D1]CAH0180870.1 hypothetical protein SRABI98_01512 [Microbacterium sp. Bi98]
MSTSDRQEQGPLTRKQLREIRLTGSTPVISAEEAAAAAAVATPPAATPPEEQDAAETEPAAPSAPAVRGETEPGNTPLTRRQVRERERSMTGSVPVGDADESDAPDSADDADSTDEVPPVEVPAAEAADAPDSDVHDSDVHDSDVHDSDVVDDDDQEDEDSAAADLPAPVSASTNLDTTDDDREPVTSGAGDTSAAVAELGIDAEATDEVDAGDVLADVDDADDDIADGERPVVNSAFGQDLLSDDAETRKPFSPSFDELLTVGDSTGSQHLAPNTLIFNPSPGEGSLSGPVASTGEILVTGSYELPKGLGSQGHAHGTTDGKDVDAVLIDGELPPASSPTPIAASAAVSTIKPAGEVIRPPAPEKGNKLMLILAIVAGGLALALGVSLIVAFTTNVF